MVISVPCCCSSALVRPSPSQSAPPSDGSRGSVPSPLTTDVAVIKTRNKAAIMLMFFRLFISFSLPIVCKPFQRTRCSLFPGIACVQTCSLGGSAGSNHGDSHSKAGARGPRGSVGGRYGAFPRIDGSRPSVPHRLAVLRLCLRSQPIKPRLFIENPMFPLTLALR